MLYIVMQDGEMISVRPAGKRGGSELERHLHSYLVSKSVRGNAALEGLQQVHITGIDDNMSLFFALRSCSDPLRHDEGFAVCVSHCQRKNCRCL